VLFLIQEYYGLCEQEFLKPIGRDVNEEEKKSRLLNLGEV